MSDNTIEFKYKVRFKWRREGYLLDLSKWCNHNCVGKFRYQYTAPIFHFEKSQDAMMFKFEILK